MNNSIDADQLKLIDALHEALAKSGWSSADIQSLSDSVFSCSSQDDVEEIMNSFLVGEEDAVKAIRVFMRRKKSASRPQEKVLGMFRPGRPIKSKQSVGSNQDLKGHVKDTSMTDLAKAARVRPVINCVGCGLIYYLLANESTGSQHSDSKQMLESGHCVFCNDLMRLDDSRSMIADVDDPSKAKEASEFKDRLLSYDKNSTKRTNVFDDQSDFFTVDSNVWLSEEEKTELKLTSHNNVLSSNEKSSLITIDLLGRRVIVQGSDLAVDESKSDMFLPLSSRLQ